MENSGLTVGERKAGPDSLANGRQGIKTVDSRSYLYMLWSWTYLILHPGDVDCQRGTGLPGDKPVTPVRGFARQRPLQNQLLTALAQKSRDQLQRLAQLSAPILAAAISQLHHCTGCKASKSHLLIVLTQHFPQDA